MKKAHLYRLVILSGILSLIACQPRYYIPNIHNVPLLRNKGNTNISLLLSDYSYEMQGSYAVTDNIGLMINGSYLGYFSSSATASERGRGSGLSGELGAGYFRPAGRNFIFETYGIFGLGRMENNFYGSPGGNTYGDIQADFKKYILQPAFGFSNGYVDIVFSNRLILLQYHHIRGNLVFQGANQPDYLYRNRSNVLYEPAFTLRTGLKNIKLQAQMVLSYNLTNRLFYQEEYLVSFGVFASLFRGKKKNSIR